MTDFDRYLEAATRANTRRSYAAAVKHFEVEWGGHLPATADGVSRYLAHYADNLAVSSHPYPAVPETLAELARRGAGLAVCTNKQELYSRRLLEALGLAPSFRALAGRDTLPVMKPHPDHLLGAIRMAGGDPARAVMVGDSETDIRTARAASIPVVAVTFGYTDTPVTELSPDAVIDHYDALIPAIERVRPR